MKNSDLPVSIVLLKPELRVNAAYRFSIIKGPFEHRQTQSQDLFTILNTNLVLLNSKQCTTQFSNKSLSANMLDNAWFSTFLFNFFLIDQQNMSNAILLLQMR